MEDCKNWACTGVENGVKVPVRKNVKNRKIFEKRKGFMIVSRLKFKPGYEKQCFVKNKPIPALRFILKDLTIIVS